MEILGIILIVAGLIPIFVGGIWFLIVAFRESILWGLGCMFIPFVSLIFLILFWQDAKKPFYYQLLGFVLIGLGVIALR